MNDPPSSETLPTALESDNPYEAPRIELRAYNTTDQPTLDVVRPLFEANGWLRFLGGVLMTLALLMGIGLLITGVIGLVFGGGGGAPFVALAWLLAWLPTYLVGWTGYNLLEAGNNFQRGGRLGVAAYFRQGLRVVAQLVRVATVLSAILVVLLAAILLNFLVMTIRFYQQVWVFD